MSLCIFAGGASAVCLAAAAGLFQARVIYVCMFILF